MCYNKFSLNLTDTTLKRELYIQLKKNMENE